ncbi:MAG TPA: ACT domain-containing protein [Coleofasciculaceae cyanobacterium]|jgi:hypothetical protein
MNQSTATLLVSCPDSPGLVAKIANFIYANGGNIIHADQHTDCATSLFLIRIEWQLEGFNLPGRRSQLPLLRSPNLERQPGSYTFPTLCPKWRSKSPFWTIVLGISSNIKLENYQVLLL